MLALHIVGGLVVGGEVLGDAGVHVADEVAREVAALAAATADDHDGRGAGDGALGLVAVGGPGNLADVVARGGRVVHRDVGLGVVGEVLGDPVVGGVVDREARVDDAVIERDAVVGIDGAGAGAAVDGVGGIATDERDGLAGGQRQRVVVVLEKDDALALDLDDDVLGLLRGTATAAVLLVVVRGIPVLGAGGVGDGGLAAADVVVDGGLEHVGAHVGGNRNADEAGGRGATRDEPATGHLLPGLLGISHGYSPSLLLQVPSFNGFGRVVFRLSRNLSF